ncbi:hypothetical protein [Flavobacterium sp.]|jgi:hypothetical protein|uniref:hypothetical protein n=1 Tax=Flavobacterium sp. TaxID=239 RepID=UPI0037C07C89
MEDKNKPVLDSLIRNGFPQLTEMDYKFTEYSLNSTFSFKFDSLNHFISFLELEAETNTQEIALLEKTFIDLGLDLNSFFYINFYDKNEALGL